MIEQRITSIDDLLQFVNGLAQKHGLNLWYRGEDNSGLPTRLLDWSRSPLIASFFATETYKAVPDKDACVWVLSPMSLNEQHFA